MGYDDDKAIFIAYAPFLRLCAYSSCLALTEDVYLELIVYNHSGAD